MATSSESATGTPATAAAWKNLADRQRGAGLFREAVGSYEQALRLQPDSAEAFNDLGIAWQYLGEWARAADCHRRALELAPFYAQAYNNLGTALKAQRRGAEAVTAFERALRLQPDSWQFAYNLGTTLHEQGEVERAVGYYRQALRLNPRDAPAANNLATALKEQGQFDEAISLLKESLQHDPNHVLAYVNLSELAAAGRYEFTAPELEHIKAILASTNSPASDRSQCRFIMAALLDKQGCYDQAFRYYQEGNDLRKQFFKERNLVFDPQEHEATTDRVMAAYDQDHFARIKGWGLDTELPIFIVGMPRSGSTLVEQILASHPQVFGAGETGEVYQFIAQSRNQPAAPLYSYPLLTDGPAARALASEYLRSFAAPAKGAARVTFKTLENHLHLGVIATLFPAARIIHCRRDPLDVCLSCYFTNFQISDFAWSLQDIAVRYRSYARLMAHWSAVLPLPIHEVRYEELVHDQEAMTRKLLAFCGLDWDDRCLTFYNTRRVVRTASRVQVRKPISASAIGRWKNYRDHLGPLLEALGQMS
jgi:tetratricopeptide (TPR) repeat protein